MDGQSAAAQSDLGSNLFKGSAILCKFDPGFSFQINVERTRFRLTVRLKSTAQCTPRRRTWSVDCLKRAVLGC